MTESAPEPFVARYSVPKLLGWVTLSGGMTALCLTFAMGSYGFPELIGLALGGAGAAFFVGISVVQFLCLFERRPQVIVDKRGLYVRARTARNGSACAR